MLIRKLLGVGTAAVFLSITAFAQAAQQPSATQPDTKATPQAKEAASAPMTLVGCLIKEADYRQAHGLGKGGIGGMRTGSDFVLVDAKTVAAGETASAPAGVAAGGSCTEQGTGQAYRMAGKTEGALKPLAGHYVVITGQFEHAHDAEAAAGERTAHLPPEIVIATYREAPMMAASAATTAAPAPSLAPPPVATTGEAPATPAPAPKMPETASNEPLIALFGVLALSAGLSLRFFRRRAI
jgi:hypothetical protein